MNCSILRIVVILNEHSVGFCRKLKMLKTSKNDFLSELIIRSSTFVEKQTIVK